MSMQFQNGGLLTPIEGPREVTHVATEGHLGKKWQPNYRPAHVHERTKASQELPPNFHIDKVRKKCI